MTNMSHYRHLRVVLFYTHMLYLRKWGWRAHTFAAATSKRAAFDAMWHQQWDLICRIVVP